MLERPAAYDADLHPPVLAPSTGREGLTGHHEIDRRLDDEAPVGSEALGLGRVVFEELVALAGPLLGFTCGHAGPHGEDVVGAVATPDEEEGAHGGDHES